MTGSDSTADTVKTQPLPSTRAKKPQLQVHVSGNNPRSVTCLLYMHLIARKKRSADIIQL